MTTRDPRDKSPERRAKPFRTYSPGRGYSPAVEDNGVCLQHLMGPQRIDVLEAIDMLGSLASLREAAAFYVEHHTTHEESLAVREVLNEYRRAKRRIYCREWHLRTIDYRIGKFAETFGKTSIAAITPAQIDKIKWLKPYRKNSGPICPQDTYGFTKLFDKVRTEAGIKDSWKPDVLRHSYASYHVAKYERKDKTAMMKGNGRHVGRSPRGRARIRRATSF